MTRGTFFYGLYSLGIVGAFLAASAYGYSPFADGGKTSGARSGGGVGGVFIGPRHK